MGAYYRGLWTREEDQRVIELYPSLGAAAIHAELPHRGVEAIRCRARILKVKRNPRPLKPDKWSRISEARKPGDSDYQGGSTI